MNSALRDQIQAAGLGDEGFVRDRRLDERLHELYLGALAVHYGPFDEDYGYVTLEGFAAARPVVTTTDAGGPLEFVHEGETGLIAGPTHAPSPTRSTGCPRPDGATPDRRRGQRAGARASCRPGRDVVARLLD